ncbi:MAG: SsrA-binding protein SmpB [Clostridia bacterium]|nr:SsrA-binding protein SmpB [Clostridia bacterium]
MPKARGIKVITANRQAFHEYFVEERYEAGISLSGTEVKSIRAGHVNLGDSYCSVYKGELFVHGMHISPYEKGNIYNRDSLRDRKLLMHRAEILKLFSAVTQKGLTLIPLSLYFKDSKVKVEVGLCKGKKLYDKRAADAKRMQEREADRYEKSNGKYD